MPLIPEVGGRGRQIPEFQASQGYLEKPCLKNQNQKENHHHFPSHDGPVWSQSKEQYQERQE